jgi:hypothetical protein
MTNTYLVRPLGIDQIAQAYPLILIFDPQLIQEQWSDYARALITQAGEGADHSIITVQSTQKAIYGLSVYWLRPDLRRGRILEIENFAVVDIAGNRKAAVLLLQALEDLARRSNCSCVSVSLLNPTMRKWLRDPRNPAIDVFRAAGFRGEQLRLRKCFAEALS